jgi:hypothetical protein
MAAEAQTVARTRISLRTHGESEMDIILADGMSCVLGDFTEPKQGVAQKWRRHVIYGVADFKDNKFRTRAIEVDFHPDSAHVFVISAELAGPNPPGLKSEESRAFAGFPVTEKYTTSKVRAPGGWCVEVYHVRTGLLTGQVTYLCFVQQPLPRGP